MMHSTPAVILRTRPLREADIWVRFATPQGRMAGIANAALKSRKRFPFGFPMGAEVNLSYQDGKSPDLVTLQDMALIHGLLGDIRITPELLGAMGYALELVDRSWPEHQSSPEKFGVLTDFLRTSATAHDPRLPLMAFCWKWLQLLGVAPLMTACARCSTAYQSQPDWRILAEAGGLVCQRCRHSQEAGIVLTGEWQPAVVQLWIAQVLDLKLNAETWWKLLWKPAQG